MKDILFNIKSNFSFFTLFSSLYGSNFSFYMHFEMSSAICFNLGQFKILSSGYGLMHMYFQTTETLIFPTLKAFVTTQSLPTSYNPVRQAFENILGKREMMVTSIFFLSQKQFQFLIHIYFIV